MRYETERKETALAVDFPHFGDFLKGDVNFDISDPETKRTICCNFDGPDRVVPEPSYDEEVGYCDPEY